METSPVRRLKVFRLSKGSVPSLANFVTALSTDGAVILKGLNTYGSVVEFSRVLGRVYLHRDSDSCGITTLKPVDAVSQRPGYRGFARCRLDLHTDCAGESAPPQFVLLNYAQLGTAGEPIIVDGREMIHRLQQNAPESLDALSSSECFFRTPEGSGHYGPIIENKSPGQFCIRFRSDEMVVVPVELQLHVHSLKRMIGELESQLNLESSDSLLLQNRRWLHGRRELSGERLVYRVLFTTECGLLSSVSPTVGFSCMGSQS